MNSIKLAVTETHPSRPQWQRYNNDSYYQAIQNQVEESWNPNNRINRQSESSTNLRSNPDQNKVGQIRPWETTSSRMNRQAADQAANTP
ncbi:MAG: hypothetical protein H0V82_04765 [Candidatus Protochlamydia sp.]|nr:hypothetical protein [Candidatus Protochlamydia sp.]